MISVQTGGCAFCSQYHIIPEFVAMVHTCKCSAGRPREEDPLGTLLESMSSRVSERTFLKTYGICSHKKVHIHKEKYVFLLKCG